ncbi:hypothetical protein [Paenibacillus wynnii]|uniref:Lipoprotein n=1 Tax=Paenibacillus wynnii TaxID=268407 RepID=A0A098M4Z5_9BACL|nr:hypothetical protein [Paenibacillus wynnii]KGE16617.1 hypothetical protein PWYN_18055 [Paenibacillus wynnii]
MFKPRKYIVGGFIGLIVVSGISGCGGNNKNNTSPTKNEVKAQTVVVTSPLPTTPTSPEQTKLYEYITNQKWAEAKKYMSDSDLQGVADLEMLQSYVDIRIEFSILSNSKDEVKLYEPILGRINKLNIDEYTGELKDQMSEFVEVFQKERNDYYDLVKRNKEAHADKKSKQLELVRWNKIKNAINQGDFNTVISETVMMKDVNEDFSAVYNFAQSSVSGQNGDDEMMFYYLNEIPINYNGKLSDLILKQKLQLKTKEEWAKDYINQRKYKSVKSSNEKEAESLLTSPSIGMSANELLNSKWGKPKDINKTITEYGTSEQWVYSDYRYVYLEDGIVTAIQN